MSGLMQALKGIGGEFEITRLIGGVGALTYILCANGFVAFDVLWLKHGFDVTAYCLAFPGGLAVAVGGTAGAAAVKDRGVAKARADTSKETT